MFKKTLIVLVGAGLLGALVFGRNLCSYVETSYAWVRDSVKENVPIDFEINRARQMVRNLNGEIKKNKHITAKQEVEIELLEEEIVHKEKCLLKRKQNIMSLKGDLASSRTVYFYAGHKYTAKQVKSDLSHRFDRYKTQEATLVSLRKILDSRRTSLNASQTKLVEIEAAKRKMEVDIENIEARLKTVEVAEAASEYNFNDSHLARTKELVNELNSRVRVMQKIADAESSYVDEIPLDEPSSDNIVDDVANYFDGKTEKDVAEKVASLETEETQE